MKKYLMTGLAAVAFCAAFTSCSKEITPMSEEEMVAVGVQKIYSDYEAAFQKVFGTPAAGHTWGFSDVAGTRAGEEIDPATHVGAYCDGNMWTSKGFKAPDPLTPGQKLRVQYYFQMNKITNPNQPNYGTKNFFMQQVYDGGDDPMTNYKEGNYSPEVYQDAGGNTITSGDHMDHLTAGPNHLHINNFNNSTCGWYNNVANWDQTDVNDENQQHKDQIELMLNTPTSCFSYANSNDTEVYDDQWTLVAGSVIDNYCENIDPTGYAAFLANHSGVTDTKVVDRWGRSFIGFDFKLMPDPDPIRRDNGVAVTAKYGDADGSLWGYAYNGTEIVRYNDTNAQILINNQPISVVIDNLNFFAAENIKGLGGQDGHNDFDVYKDFVPGGANNDCLYLKKHTNGVQDDHVALNLKFIERMVNDGYLPVYGKHLKLWVKVSDLTDGYYTDWIVSFMPADYNPPTPPSSANIRVMAEDLSAGESGEDFDFNDVVFDVYFSDEVGEAYVMVQAAGGTLPLTVHGTEVHRLFNQPTNKMINTQAEKKGLNGISGLAPQKIQLTGITVNSKEEANTKIKICVTKEIKLPDGSTKNEPIELVNSGAAACKIGVPPTTGIAVERTNVNGVLGSNEWVTNGILWPTN